MIVPKLTQGFMFILQALKPPQLSLSKWLTLLSEDVIQADRSILFCPSLCAISPIVFLKGFATGPLSFPGTLTPVASPASLEHILGEENKARKAQRVNRHQRRVCGAEARCATVKIHLTSYS